MKNLVCPVSPEKVYDAIPRVIAFQVVSLLLLFVLLPNVYVPLVLIVDFYLRSFGKGKYSLLSIFAEQFSTITNIKGDKINKAPKVFAARLGLVFSLLVLGSFIVGFQQLSFSLVALFLLCAALELFVNFCVGCYIYTYIVLPFYKN